MSDDGIVYLGVAVGTALSVALLAACEAPRWRAGDVACTVLSGDRVYVIESGPQPLVRFTSGLAVYVTDGELKECPP